MSKFKFIDLFAGIGGFHQAMSQLGGECVFASEIDQYAIEAYNNNYHMNSDYDVTKVNPKDLPFYNVMCAGFPCQAFSKAGGQLGFKDETRGTLFFEIERLLQYRVNINEPVKYIILENVSNLVTHDKGKTWKVIKKHLLKLGYNLTEEPILMSPHQIGIPQLRNRVFILGVHKSYNEDLNITLPNNKPGQRNLTDAYSIVTNKRVANEYYISEYEERVLTIWNEFYQGIKEKIIGFPIWSSEFIKSSYTIEEPKWKQDIKIKNLKLYNNNKDFIDYWLKKYDYLSGLVKTHRKFEWQAGNHIKSIWEGIIQFRPSGVRVKRPTEFPALVAMVHKPILGKYRRHLTVIEAAKLQSFPSNFSPHLNNQQAYKQFGNSVNVDVVKYLAEQLINQK